MCKLKCRNSYIQNLTFGEAVLPALSDDADPLREPLLLPGLTLGDPTLPCESFLLALDGRDEDLVGVDALFEAEPDSKEMENIFCKLNPGDLKCSMPP